MFIAIHAGHYWHKMVYEIVSECLSLEEVLLPLRKIVYWLVQGQSKGSVIETGRIMNQQLQRWEVFIVK